MSTKKRPLVKPSTVPCLSHSLEMWCGTVPCFSQNHLVSRPLDLELQLVVTWKQIVQARAVLNPHASPVELSGDDQHAVFEVRNPP